MPWRSALNYLQGPTQVTIEDGRRARLPGWEECGFERLDHRTSVDDWADDAAIEGVHYPEMEELAAKLTGCDHALVWGHIKRNVDEAAKHGDLAPITFVHSDFADSYGPQVRERYRSGEAGFAESLVRAGIEAEVVASARRIVILQFWRNVGPPKMDLPLAFCDARTVGRDQVQPIQVKNYAGGGFDFEALGVMKPRDPDDARVVRLRLAPRQRGHRLPDLRQRPCRHRPPVLDAALGVPGPRRRARTSESLEHRAPGDLRLRLSVRRAAARRRSRPAARRR